MRRRRRVVTVHLTLTLAALRVIKRSTQVYVLHMNIYRGTEVKCI